MKKLWMLDFAEQGIVYGNENSQYHEFYDVGVDEDGELFLVDTERSLISIFSPNTPETKTQIEWADFLIPLSLKRVTEY